MVQGDSWRGWTKGRESQATWDFEEGVIQGPSGVIQGDSGECQF